MSRWTVCCSVLDMHGVPCGFEVTYDDKDAGAVARIVIHLLNTGHEPDPAVLQ